MVYGCDVNERDAHIYKAMARRGKLKRVAWSVFQKSLTEEDVKSFLQKSDVAHGEDDDSSYETEIKNPCLLLCLSSPSPFNHAHQLQRAASTLCHL